MYTILLKQETPTNTNATGTFASFWHVCETLIEALSCSLWDCFWVVKVLTATNATNETRQHGIAWNQTSLGLTNKHFQPKPDLSINKTPRWTSANQPQNSQSIRKALQKKMLSLHHWKDSHMKPNGVIHYDFNFFGLTLPLQKLAFVPRFSSEPSESFTSQAGAITRRAEGRERSPLVNVYAAKWVKTKQVFFLLDGCFPQGSR